MWNGAPLRTSSIGLYVVVMDNTLLCYADRETGNLYINYLNFKITGIAADVNMLNMRSCEKHLGKPNDLNSDSSQNVILGSLCRTVWMIYTRYEYGTMNDRALNVEENSWMWLTAVLRRRPRDRRYARGERQEWLGQRRREW